MPVGIILYGGIYKNKISQFLANKSDNTPLTDEPKYLNEKNSNNHKDVGLLLPQIEELSNNHKDVGLMLPPIEELSQTSSYSCPEGLVKVNDNHLPREITHLGRKIPKIIHITSKSRCVTHAAYELVEKWRFPGHSLYFHDDIAVDRLLRFNHTGTSQEISKNLTKVVSCVTNGAAKSDIWRYLIAWHYGGIYTDIDNLPSKFNGESISPSDDAFFTIESLGVLGQFFFAVSPKHPIMKHTLNAAIRALERTVNVMRNNPAGTTGPRALKNGFILFQRAVGIVTDGYVTAGIYKGGVATTADYDSSSSNHHRQLENNKLLEQRNCTVVGNKTNPQEYILRSGLSARDKKDLYEKTNMIHHHASHNGAYGRVGRIGCLEHIRRQEMKYNGTFYKVANYMQIDGNKYVEV